MLSAAVTRRFTCSQENFHVALVVKSPPANVRSIKDAGSIPGLGRSPVEGNATHSSILAWRIPMDRGARWATVHGVVKSQTRLSDEYTHKNRS